MPTTTFLNLNEDKQNQIFHALIKEFSQYRLTEAQVARIINDCSIARGSFYKYFEDIHDSYRYALKRVLKEVHFDVFQQIRAEKQNSLQAFYDATTSFIEDLKGTQYEFFYQKYVVYNQFELKHKEYDYRKMPEEYLVLLVDGRPVSDKEQIIITYKWATSAAHETIRNVLSGGNQEQLFSDFASLLKLLNKGLRNRG
ncbi:MAG: TetR/AcrR family transcriptional regulator [Apilactobacillus sp.]|uniref:TetR/AcrR family transcriptional regulator n=1 Tax=Apilactobacillus sp. TaxID=2767901 RepID=UPI0025D52722|nr:TetR/AcrR family transcriptional regulator [Apilactobacillus sp.]MCT6823029.1 TetR/AcrR family transcriptional regulator [Apilactobacillus sp.]MCT6858460.1 TetR/AcrR family transcriptional regulator [Apilactobacillus sp.]